MSAAVIVNPDDTEHRARAFVRKWFAALDPEGQVALLLWLQLQGYDAVRDEAKVLELLKNVGR